MASFDRSSPVLAITPQAIHQTPFGKAFQHHASAWVQQQHVTRASLVAGRKRSRDEAAVNLDPPEKVVEPISSEPEDEWIYGPGMTLIKKSTGYAADAGSQSGTWVEDKAAKEEAAKREAALLAQQHMSQERPSLRSHKSQRLSTRRLSTTCSDKGEGRASSPAAASETASSTADSLPQPIVDDFTIHLGIGWSRLSGSEHIQAAARGWARYIENHYPVTNVQIRLESRGLQSYLVEATEGFFLFAENLRQGRLVSRTADGALQNLKKSPPVFDGPETMEASGTPKLIPSVPSSVVAPVSMLPSATVDMDMS